MKNVLIACAAAAALLAVLTVSGCGREGPEDEESAIERMKEIWAGGGKEMEEHEGPEEHMGPMEGHDEEMEEQHEAMRELAGEWMKARGAALGGKPSDAVGPAKKMQEAAGGMEGFMPHRDAGRRDDFIKMSQEFKSLVMRFTTYAEKGDTKSLREVAPEIDKACNDCHQTFR